MFVLIRTESPVRYYKSTNITREFLSPPPPSPPVFHIFDQIYYFEIIPL